MFNLEMEVPFMDTALSKDDDLFAACEGVDGDGPLFESGLAQVWHSSNFLASRRLPGVPSEQRIELYEGRVIPRSGFHGRGTRECERNADVGSGCGSRVVSNADSNNRGNAVGSVAKHLEGVGCGRFHYFCDLDAL